MTYCYKEPVKVEAVRWTGDNVEEIKALCGNNVTFVNLCLSATVPAVCVCAFGVKMYAHPGDYIVKDMNGVICPYTSDIFEEIYEEVEE